MKREPHPYREAWIFLLITLGLSLFVFWGPLAVFRIPAASLDGGAGGPIWAILLFILGGFTPSLVAVLMTVIINSGKGLRALLKRLNPRTMNWKWHGVILLVVFLGTGGQLLVFNVVGVGIDYSLFWKRLVWLLPLLILGPFSEELGWRGYALDRLQTRLNALFSSLIVGIVWALWHLPLFYIIGTAQNLYGMSFITFAVGVLATSILYTWVYNNTGGSIWSAVFFHWISTYVMDVLGAGVVPPPKAYLLLQSIPYVLIALAVIAVWGPKTLTRKSVVSNGLR